MAQIESGARPAAANASPALPQVEITRRAARRIAGGYLWIYSNEIDSPHTSQPAVCWCVFTCEGQPHATGYFNRHSLIAGRVVARGAVNDLSGLLSGRLREAFRRRLPQASNRASRLVFSEADLLPGLVVDRYPPHMVLQCNTAGMDRVLPVLETLVPEVHAAVFKRAPEGVVVRCDSGVRRLEGVERFSRVVAGEPAALSGAVVEEDGVRYAADLLSGQKTGFFLDQRLNRRYLASLLRGRAAAEVLDLYCYSGGFGLRALREGAGRVTFVDQSRPALELVKRGLSLNGWSAAQAETAPADAFDFLETADRSYDVMVVDPPAFVKSRKNLPQALKAYQKLNRLAWRRLNPGGVLLTCSCSHLLSEEAFLSILHRAVAREEGRAAIIYRGGQPEDHPVLLSMPETAYLKCVALEKMAP
jgi:23S rRNA (cytosine1962-C5)-methyltransferase